MNGTEDDDLLAAIQCGTRESSVRAVVTREKRSKERFQQIRFNGKPSALGGGLDLGSWSCRPTQANA
jgi:hypothetical protein